ncbi:MAG: hypothetical protein K2G11_07265 [Muribaculaceae bacterium]|nr:hypothetical protein [Muribaculaceae bacterium]
MAIAKGLSINQAERCVVMQGFYEQLEIAQQSQCTQEASIKAKLYDIIEDNSLDEDEKQSLKKPLISELEEIENKHIRIRRSALIGLYSFWEVSLNAILSSQSLIYSHSNKDNRQIERTSKKSKAWNYLKQIYGEDIPNTSLLIDDAIRECRNYIVHGHLSLRQEETIRTLEVSNPEFCIGIICGNCVITQYSGLRHLLEYISRELDNAELAAKKQHNQN